MKILRLLICSIATTASFSINTSFADVPKITGPAIPYNHLSSEKTEPYLVLGKTPELRADIRAAKKWPDARSCLIKTEMDKEVPDLRLINWQKMQKDTDISVCIFRIVNSLGTPEKTKSWFEAQGLNALIKKSNNEYIKTAVGVQAWHKITKDNRILVPPSGLKSIALSIIGHTEYFGAYWNKSGQLYKTGHGISAE